MDNLQQVSPAIERPVDIIHDRLSQAHATLDLLYTLTASPRNSHELIEEMCDGTLHNALHGAMLRISEAMEAADRIGVNHD